MQNFQEFLTMEAKEQVSSAGGMAEWESSGKVGDYTGALFSSIIDHLPGIYFLKDSECRYVFVNQKFEKAFGLSRDVWYQRTDFDFMGRQEAEACYLGDRMVMSQRRPLQRLEPVQTKSGLTHWLISKYYVDMGSAGGWLAGIGIDVTERVQTENRLRFVTENTPNVLFRLDAEGRMDFLSGAFERVLDRPMPKEIRLRSAFFGSALIEDGPRIESFLKRLPQLQADQLVYRIRTRSGAIRYLRLTCNPAENLVEGESRSLVGVLEDVSEQELLAQELRRASSDAERASRAKSRFLATVSHEMRTPLVSILGYTDALLDHRVDAAQSRQFLEIIRNNGRMLADLISDTLDLSKIEAGRMDWQWQPVLLAEMLADIEQMLLPEIKGKGLKFSVRIDSDVPERLISDAVRLRQILVNLIGNSVKYTDIGHVGVHVTVFPTSYRERRTLAFEIFDTGRGIPAKMQARLFEPYVRASGDVNKDVTGTGLGLVVARQLSRALYGDVELLSSQCETGSRFLLTISEPPPQVVSHLGLWSTKVRDSDNEKRKVAADQFQPLQGRRILVVDDCSDIKKMLAFHLKRKGAVVSMADNGEDAVAQGSAVDFDAILMDLEMPVMNGRDAAKILRGRGLKTPILALTANALSEIESSLRCNGFDDSITKPFEIDSLVDKLQDCFYEDVRGGLSRPT